MMLTSQLQADILAVLTHDWQSLSQIWKRMDCWSKSSIKHRLIAMLADGVVETRIVEISPQSTRREWRLAAKKDE